MVALFAGKGRPVSTVEEGRRTRECEEEVRRMNERLKEIRARRQQASSDFTAAQKELDAIRESAGQQADENWTERFDAARQDFFASRNVLTELQAKLDELLAARPSSRSRRRRDNQSAA
jgi:hypothetical protein